MPSVHAPIVTIPEEACSGTARLGELAGRVFQAGAGAES